MIKIALAIITVSVLTSNPVFASDWKFYGGSIGETKKDFFAFYDSESIKKTDNFIKVWIKAILAKDIDNLLDNKKLNKSIIEKSAQKVATGYRPPYSTITPEIDFDGNVNVISYEETANHPSSSVKYKALYELDCAEQKLKVLSQTFFEKKKVPKSSEIVTDWQYIAPESNAEKLYKILCK